MLSAVLALLLTGCSGGDGGSDSATGSAAPTATPAFTPTPSASPSPPYPTNSAGCHSTDGWTQEQTVDWVRLESKTPESFTQLHENVRLTKSLVGYDGPLCAPVTVQVQFWKLTYGSPADGDKVPLPSESSPDYYFFMESVKRTEVRIDGTAEKSIPVPTSLYDGKLSVCEGALLAVYVGKPLTDKELPEEIQTGGSTFGDNVSFKTERIAEQQLSPPASPEVCGPEGTPTADPYSPPGLTDPLSPTGRPSFDMRDLMPPTPQG
jgi:hypothetical protein